MRLSLSGPSNQALFRSEVSRKIHECRNWLPSLKSRGCSVVWLAGLLGLTFLALQAAVFISAARADEPENEPQLIKYMRMSKRNYKSAINGLNQQITVAQGKQKVTLLLARAAIVAEHGSDARALDDALADVNTALSIDPKSAAAYYRKAEILANKNDLKMALAAVDESLKLNPGSFLEHMLKGKIAAVAGDLKTAYAEFTFCLQSKWLTAESYRHRAGVLVRLNRLPEAVADYSKAIEITSGDDKLRCLAARARVYSKLGMKDLADKDMAALKQGAEFSNFTP